jgi:ATP-binding cassette subfamily B protein
MASLNLRLTVLALLPLPFITVATRYFGHAIHTRFERIQAQLSEMSAVTQEALAGVRVVRAYGQEAHELERFRVSNQEYVERNRALIRLQGMFYPSLGLFMGVAELIVLWLGAREVILGRMTVGELVAFNTYLVMLGWPMIAFGWVTNLLQRGRASWARMLEVLDMESPIDDRHVTHPELRPGDVQGAITLRDLSFSYAGTPVLSHLSLTVPAGQTLAIVGRTGSGKSTLLALLARLHDPPAGTIFIDGVDVREMPLATLRGSIGFVAQEPFLFSDTVEANIAFGASEGAVPVGDIRAAAEISRLARDVADFPDGYQTRIGERGITLSGGQKQRTALARALYIDPRILILDDAMSAVDTQTEHEILQGLRAFRQGRTTLIVSHRVSTVREADQIIVLDKGAIAEQGTHDQLVDLGGLYAQLHRQQLLEEELAAS